jgi:orotidine-5'-phosphate decarboxylase
MKFYYTLVSRHQAGQGGFVLELFIDRLLEKIRAKKNPTVVGLDPRLDLLPEEFHEKYFQDDDTRTQENASKAILDFNCRIIDIIAPIVPAVKPQVAFYEMFGPSGMAAYFSTIDYAQKKGLLVIGDVKRGDIGSTAEAYVQAHIKRALVSNVPTGGQAQADAVTVNPYLGEDGVSPFIKTCKENGSGIFVLVKTSNPSSEDFQNLECNNNCLYMIVAEKVCTWGQDLRGEKGYSSIGAVVGATYPETIAEIRKKFPFLFFLIPGYGAQGGTAEMIQAAFDKNGEGAIVNSSRGIIFAGQKSTLPWDEAVKRAALEMKHNLCRMVGWS